jgi:hypothetical protein
MKFFSENHSGHVNIDSGTGSFFHPFQTGIHIHIPPESVFTSLRNDYSHAPESATSNGGVIHGRLNIPNRRGNRPRSDYEAGVEFSGSFDSAGSDVH